MTNILVKRIRNRNNHPCGVLLAKKLTDTEVGIGWSLCNKHDAFDMELGKLKAECKTVSFRPNKIPNSIRKEYIEFAKRAERYFKGQSIIGIQTFKSE